MSRKPAAKFTGTNLTVAVPPTFVGTVYSSAHGVYIAQRKDGSVTVGQIGQRGLNVQAGLVDFESDNTLRSES